MVGIVVVSHSYKIAQGIKELSQELIPRQIPLIAVGGTKDGRIGTEIDEIIEAVKHVYSEEGVIIIGDVGSSLINSKMALELLSLEGYEAVTVSEAPLVEGAMVATIESNLGKSLEGINQKIENQQAVELI
ncbi:PTS-dependent dihydroxyacetone kinase phosphotransferase subunit DhaM [Natroniella sulfidigena]|uniref:dihydroxyacetone kinase phosphoryl donor subunit DhaM n=1 Tax=Natroniella sulfidigena TaxID=723921 RepID=UPI002009EE68|nr:dihydroxyacetone kinase phosphoryl donor subunit DhaM [Natroniella sulfidigena]MCK8817460.1 PTS-dependent dihydroxyacetone kinase phosphotransferase subunit DhaM [Natroniella sulfidigena]